MNKLHLVFLPGLLTLFQKQPPEMFCKNDVPKNFAKFTGKHLCQSLFFNKVAPLSLTTSLKIKETLEQVLYCESCEIFKNVFFHRIPPVAASVVYS